MNRAIGAGAFLALLGACVTRQELFARGLQTGTEDSGTTAASGPNPGSTDGGGSTTGDRDTTGPDAPSPQGCGAATARPGFCPTPGVTWHLQFQGMIDRSLAVDVYDVDLEAAATDLVDELHGAGRQVICAFSAGTHEDFRPDADAFPPEALGEPVEQWPDERWLDIRHPEVRSLLATRIERAAGQGCDAIEPQNLHGWTQTTGFALTAADQIEFNLWLAEQGHAAGLSVGLDGDLEQVHELVHAFDWAGNESCFTQGTCDALDAFVTANKAVFQVEYVDDPAQGDARAQAVCPQAQTRRFSTLIKQVDLGAWGVACG